VSIVRTYRGVDIFAQIGISSWRNTYGKPWVTREAMLRQAPLNFKVYPSVSEEIEKLRARLDLELGRCKGHNPIVKDHEIMVRAMLLSWFEKGL
jgi:hypothetical protein